MTKTIQLTEGAAKALALIATRNELRVTAVRVEAQLAEVSLDDRAIADQIIAATTDEAVQRWALPDRRPRASRLEVGELLAATRELSPEDRAQLIGWLLSDLNEEQEEWLGEIVPPTWQSPLKHQRPADDNLENAPVLGWSMDELRNMADQAAAAGVGRGPGFTQFRSGGSPKAEDVAAGARTSFYAQTGIANRVVEPLDGALGSDVDVDQLEEEDESIRRASARAAGRTSHRRVSIVPPSKEVIDQMKPDELGALVLAGDGTWLYCGAASTWLRAAGPGQIAHVCYPSLEPIPIKKTAGLLKGRQVKWGPLADPQQWGIWVAPEDGPLPTGDVEEPDEPADEEER